MPKVKPKTSFIRRQLWAMVFSAVVTSCGAYYWKELASLGSYVAGKVLNRQAAEKSDNTVRLPGILTSFQKKD